MMNKIKECPKCGKRIKLEDFLHVNRNIAEEIVLHIIWNNEKIPFNCYCFERFYKNNYRFKKGVWFIK